MAEPSFQLTSPAFGHAEAIPARFTCEGDDVSPPLAWSAPPGGTKSFAIVVDDPDAPDPKAPRTTWVHWVVYNLPATARELREGAGSGALPDGAHAGNNDWKRSGYGGPCPPVGRHRYVHKLYALDAMLPERQVLTKAELERAIEGHVLAHAELIGTYEKRKR